MDDTRPKLDEGHLNREVTGSRYLSFRGTDVRTFLRLSYDTFHRDRAVRQLLLTAFQYLVSSHSGLSPVREPLDSDTNL